MINRSTADRSGKPQGAGDLPGAHEIDVELLLRHGLVIDTLQTVARRVVSQRVGGAVVAAGPQFEEKPDDFAVAGRRGPGEWQRGRLGKKGQEPAAGGVDALWNNKGFLVDVLGVGDFDYELALRFAL